MRALYYTLRTLIRGRGSNIIKIISLTLGLFAGILLFTKIATEMSYDTGYNEADNLCVVMAYYTLEGTKEIPMNAVMGPVPGTIAEAFREIEYSTTFGYAEEQQYFIGDKQYSYNTIYGDTLFFQTIGINLLQGNVKELANPNMVFISDKFAKAAFGDENPIGKTITRDMKHELTVRGVFREVPENNSIRPDAVISFQQAGYYGWGAGDSYKGCVRLHPGADIEKINARIDAVIEPYMEFNPEKNGWGVQYRLQKAQDVHLKNPELRTRIGIMSILGFVLLLIASLNYVLVSISSLTLRAKGVGVHKCNGASENNIFTMFMWETSIIIGGALLLVLLMILSFRELIEDLLGSSITMMFTWNTLWVPLVVAIFLFIVSGVIPGRIFAKIPVTQVFRRYTEGKQGWKHPLLFVQFAGVSFIFGLLCVVMTQYRQMTTFDVGYTPEGLASAWHHFENRDVARSTLKGLPMVEEVAFSTFDMGGELSADFVYGDDGKTLFSTQFNVCDRYYPSLVGIKIVEGKTLDGPNQLLVNQEYVRRMRWIDGAIGKRGSGSAAEESVIVGVMEDFVDESLFTAVQPVSFFCDDWQYTTTVRLKEPYRESLKALNEAMKEIFPTSRIEFTYMPDRLKLRYESARKFRDMLVFSFASILLIALMGLFGYVNDEVRRRSKEIAIRKVNGAESYDILLLLSKQLIWIALPAVAIGTVCAYFAGKEWLTQFERFQISLNIALFILVAILMWITIFSAVIMKAWRIANDNPVNSIKSE